MYNSQIMANRVKQLAQSKNISIKKLMEDCGLGENALSQAAKSESGMKAKNLYAIADILQCSIDYILGRTDKINPEANIKQNANHGLNMGIIEYSPAISFSMPSEQQQEISNILSDLSPRERNKLMTMIYDYYDECKKGK